MALTDREIFLTVLEAISADEKFSTFIDRFLDRVAPHISVFEDGLEGPHALRWPCLDATFNAVPEVGGLNREAAEFSLAHTRAFESYCAFYESRVRSTLAAVRQSLGLEDARLTEERFAELCVECSASHTESNSNEASTAEVCGTLVQMFQCVGNFEGFAQMAAQRQWQSIHVDDDEPR